MGKIYHTIKASHGRSETNYYRQHKHHPPDAEITQFKKDARTEHARAQGVNFDEVRLGTHRSHQRNPMGTKI